MFSVIRKPKAPRKPRRSNKTTDDNPQEATEEDDCLHVSASSIRKSGPRKLAWIVHNAMNSTCFAPWKDELVQKTAELHEFQAWMTKMSAESKTADELKRHTSEITALLRRLRNKQSANIVRRQKEAFVSELKEKLQAATKRIEQLERELASWKGNNGTPVSASSSSDDVESYSSDQTDSISTGQEDAGVYNETNDQPIYYIPPPVMLEHQPDLYEFCPKDMPSTIDPVCMHRLPFDLGMLSPRSTDGGLPSSLHSTCISFE